MYSVICSFLHAFLYLLPCMFDSFQFNLILGQDFVYPIISVLVTYVVLVLIGGTKISVFILFSFNLVSHFANSIYIMIFGTFSDIA